MELAVSASTVQQLLMPVVVFIVIGALALVLRWSQTPARNRRAARRGLLVTLARLPTQDAADRVTTRLRHGGIRATSSQAESGVDVLVWPEEYGEARLLVRGDEQRGNGG
ncbi:hypothetical protein [Solicola gregarius]|uniref:Uncharacterized protein n=1 Tax=Solicola gregarius TaxID=2908642 RepID=A0AA46TIY1_9ACTN|nr:hypothetical protein [Solicola gregarius]UYM05973.1 hypothetical protein L0C25_02540 [Solicola gregarius]